MKEKVDYLLRLLIENGEHYLKYNFRKNNVTVEYMIDIGYGVMNDKFSVFPIRKIVCPDCHGTGAELRGGLKGAVFTEDDMRDPGFDEVMGNIVSGVYDVACIGCNGLNVVDMPNLDNITDKEMNEILTYFEELESERQAAYWEGEGERRMGC